MAKNIAILIFDEVEVLDFAGPFEVFSVTGLRGPAEAPFNVYTVAEKADPISARNNLRVTPRYTLENSPPPDIVAIPGGFGAHRWPQAMTHNKAVLEWVQEQHKRTELTPSVCTGSLVLARAGLLDGLQATTHHASYERLAAFAPTATVIRDVRFVGNDKVITSAGVQAGHGYVITCRGAPPGRGSGPRDR